MSVQVKHRRDTAANIASFTPAQGEIIVDTTNSRMIVGDGATVGGFPAAKLSEVVTSLRRGVADTNTAITSSDRIVSFTTLTAARVVTLPAASTYPTGVVLFIVDESGNCSSTNTITINRSGSDTICGQTSVVLNGSYMSSLLVSDGSSKWTLLADDLTQQYSVLGIGTSPDPSNPLSVYGTSALLSSGSDFRVTVNKNSVSNTASFLFQNNFSGRAEFGLTGNDSFSLKMSPNGSTWLTALTASMTEVAVNPVSSSMTTFSVGPHNMSSSWYSGGAAMEISQGISGDRYAFFDFHASDAQSDFSSRFIRNPAVDGNFEIVNIGQGAVSIYTAASGTAGVLLGTAGVTRVEVTDSSFSPNTDNSYSLGASGARWSAVWSANGTIQTSDERDKIIDRNISSSEAMALVQNIDPVLFRWKQGSNYVEEIERSSRLMNPDNPESKSVEEVKTQVLSLPGRRLHAGFIAQDMKSAMDKLGLDFGVWGLDDVSDPDSKQWIRPDQLIPVLWKAVQDLKLEVDELRKKSS